MDNNNENTKKCIYCSMDIDAHAGRCPYCGSLLEVSVDRNIFINPTNGEQSPSEAAPEKENTEAAAGYRTEPGIQPENKAVPVANPIQNSVNANRQAYKQPSGNENFRAPLSNGLKVLLTVISAVIPGIGQLIGIITAIVFMNTDNDADRKSFGVALLVASIILFVLSCIGCFVLILVFSINQSSVFYGN